ncbi:MAG TPA: response regulator [Polyangia bacterium]|nr:response regulator [Polyangia bacterium]
MSGAGGAILLVDDDEIFRERLARALRDRGRSVVTAAGHDGALAAARARVFAFAVVDLKMPGLSGLDVVRDLLSVTASMRVVMLTGYGSIPSTVEALRRGAHDFLSKPVDADDIIAALERDQSATGGPRPAVASVPTLARAEWEHISRILGDCDGNISEAARRLGITRRTLQLKLKKYPPRR